MKLRFILLSLVIIVQLFLSGCWDYTEYENTRHVVAMAIDYDKNTNEFTVATQHIPTSISGSGKGSGTSKSSPDKTGVIHSVTNKTMYGALLKHQQVATKELFFGYLKVIIIGEKTAEYKMKDIMEFLDRTPEVRLTAYIIIVSGKAEDVIGTVDTGSSISPGQEISNLINLSKNTGTSYPVKLQDFLAAMAIGGLEATAPHIITTYQDQELEVKGGEKGSFRLDVQRSGNHVLSGTAVFKADKLAGWLNDKESLGYGWITGKKIYTYKTTENSDEENPEDIVYFRIAKSKSKIKIQIKCDKPIINVAVDIKAQMRKYFANKGSEFINPEELNIIEKKLSESIRSDIEAALAKAQKEYKSDIFGFGFALFRKSPKLWRNVYEKKWEDTFPDIPVNIKVKTKIINTGSNIRKLDIK